MTNQNAKDNAKVIEQPEITEKIGGYDLRWPLARLEIGVSRIKQHKDNRVTGWLRIISLKHNPPFLLHQCELNFASSQTYTQLVNSMDKRFADWEWANTLEQLRFYILERVRQGEPVQTGFTSDDTIAPPNYLVEPIMPENQPTILFGDPGVAKSLQAHLIYICLTLPWFDNPMGWGVPEKPTSALILDWETDYNTTMWRMKCLQRGMGLPPFQVNYRRCMHSLADDLEQIQLYIDMYKAQVIIIDSCTAAAGGEVMEASTASNFFIALRQLKTTSLIIAQNQKNTENKVKSPLGSTIFQYYARSIWEAKKAQAEGEDEIHIALYHRKANEDKLHHPIGYRFDFNKPKELTTVKMENISSVPEFRDDLTAGNKVLQAILELGKAKTEEIAEAAGMTVTQCRVNLSRLKKKEKIYQFEDKSYGVAANVLDI